MIAKLRKITAYIALNILFSYIVGCSNIPFKRVTYIPLEGFDPMSVLEKHKQGVPENINLFNTIVIQYYWKKFLAIGLLAASSKKKTFKFVCFNPMGLKLLEVSGDRDYAKRLFAVDMLAKNTNLDHVAEDIRRIYFDLFPSVDAKVIKRKQEIIFRQNCGKGRIEYLFAGIDVHMIQKKYYENDRLLWKVSYYEYEVKDGKLYPKGIVLDNFKYAYSLTLKLKKIQ